MKIQIPKNCKQKDLPDILKIPVMLNLEDFKLRNPPFFNKRPILTELTIGDFEWVSSIETVKFNCNAGLWEKLNNGYEVEIPSEIEYYWLTLLEPSIKVEITDNTVYYATSNNKRFKITIEEIKDVKI